MDYLALLKDWTRQPGVSGNEGAGAAQAIADSFSPYCAVETDVLQNVVASLGEGALSVLVTAHQDEIGLMTTVVEDDGAIRVTRVGGADPRTLYASRVWVHADGGDLLGVVGATIPFLLGPDAIKRNYELDDLYIDVGLPAQTVRERVPAGTLVTLDGESIALANGRIASKSLDDRVGVAAMLRAAELLSKRKIHSRVHFAATAQEEVGAYGAMTAAHRLSPDLAIVLDVTIGQTHGVDERAHPLDSLTATAGPFIHPGLHQLLLDTAKAEHVTVERAFAGRWTGTDTDTIQTAREGIPCVLLGLPVLNMHTPIETVSRDTIEEAGRLLAAFIAKLDEKEAGWLCNWND
jgi:endoglucanase